MQCEIEEFLEYLRVERGASEYTLKSYGEDLSQFHQYLDDSGREQKVKDSHYQILELWFISHLPVIRDRQQI